jgi:hypothetical protein
MREVRDHLRHADHRQLCLRVRAGYGSVDSTWGRVTHRNAFDDSISPRRLGSAREPDTNEGHSEQPLANAALSPAHVRQTQPWPST